MSTPQSTQSARILGYTLVLGCLLCLGLLASFLLREAVDTGRTIRVHFPEIATLSQGDPVVRQGVTVGKVRRIAIENGDPVVELQLFDHHFLAADTRFANVSHSLMGARKVWLEPGTSPLPLDEKVLQEGVFVPGLPETLHKVNALTGLVKKLRADSERLFDEKGAAGGSLAAALAVQRQLDELTQGLDMIAGRLDDASGGLRKGLARLSTLAATGDRTAADLRALEPRLDRTWRRVDTLMASLAAVEGGLTAALAQTERLAAAANDSTGAGRLLTDRAVYDGLLKSVDSLAAIAELLRFEGLGDEMPIKPRLRNRN
jgi:ABC-type transporter Mla subunit MlaD